MYVRLAVVALALAVCQAFPQHGYVNFGRAGGYRGGFASGFGGYGGHISALPVVSKVAAVPVAQKVAVAPVVAKAVQVEAYAPPHYQFEYAVNDQHTGDIKSQHEERDGDSTRGYYTLHEPDGTILTVHYTVDGHSGFNAVVERSGHGAHPQQVVQHAAVPLRKVY